jgi:hypothetical protein
VETLDDNHSGQRKEKKKTRICVINCNNFRYRLTGLWAASRVPCARLGAQGESSIEESGGGGGERLWCDSKCIVV